MRRLVTGSFTPYLLPGSSDGERDLVDRCLRGEIPAGARHSLEQHLEAMLGTGWHVHSCSSARAAIQIALQASNVSPGSEVLIPSFLCSSVAVAVIQAGMRPVLVDVDEDFNIRLESVAEAYRPEARAVVLAHLAGRWARDADAIVSWARERNVFVIDDAAQAFGLQFQGRAAGTLGDVGVFSSGPGKPIFGPGGGWLVARSPAVIRNLRSLRLAEETKTDAIRRLRTFVNRFSQSGGQRGRRILRDALAARLGRRAPSAESNGNMAVTAGFSIAAMGDLDAAIAEPQMKEIGQAIAARSEFAARWRGFLSALGLPGLRVPPPEGNTHTHMLLSFPTSLGERQSASLRRVLWAHGVETEVFYTPLHLRPPFDRLRRTPMVNTERQWRGAFAVPVRPNLTAVDWERIEHGVRHAARALSQ